MERIASRETGTVALTPQEKRIYGLLLQACSDKEISTAMGISWHTVRFHVTNILRKYHVTTRSQLFLPFVK